MGVIAACAGRQRTERTTGERGPAGQDRPPETFSFSEAPDFYYLCRFPSSSQEAKDRCVNEMRYMQPRIKGFNQEYLQCENPVRSDEGERWSAITMRCPQNGLIVGKSIDAADAFFRSNGYQDSDPMVGMSCPIERDPRRMTNVVHGVIKGAALCIKLREITKRGEEVVHASWDLFCKTTETAQ